MHEDLYVHPKIKPLLDTGPEVPRNAIEDLAEEIRKNKTLAGRCNRLFKLEASVADVPRRYFVIWLAFGLALAEEEEAIETFNDLFDLIDPLEHDMLWELAQFTLWQYGDRAVRRMLEDFWRIVEIDHTGYLLGVLEVVGLSKDQLLRRRVADKVIEALLSPKTSPAALMGLVDLALILEDPRLPSILGEWKMRLAPKERRVLEEAEQLLLGSDPSLRNEEFRLNWFELAEFSAEHFSIHYDNQLATPDDEELENISEEFAKLAETFRRSDRYREIPERWRREPNKVDQLLVSIFNLLFESFGTLPDEADAEEIAALMVDVLPRKMVGEVFSFKPIPPVLASFFRFLTDGYSREEGDEFVSLISSSEREMLRRAADPDYWDPAKAAAMKNLR